MVYIYQLAKEYLRSISDNKTLENEKKKKLCTGVITAPQRRLGEFQLI